MADPSPYLIAGGMPFGPGGNPYSGGGIGGLAPAYQQSYNSALAQNQALYSNILQGYQQTIGNQVSAQQAIGGGYNQLYNNVLGGIQGIGASQKQAIADVYAQQAGQTQQSMVSRGLGNTTVADSAQRGLLLDRTKAETGLANQIAALNAGYQSQLGLAGLNQQNQANMQNTGQANQQLGWMNTVQAQYPQAAAYNQLAQMYGMAGQADKDRAAMMAIANKPIYGGGAGGVVAGGRQGMGGTNFPTGLYSHGGGFDSGISYTGGGGGGGFTGNMGGPGITGGTMQMPDQSPVQSFTVPGQVQYSPLGQGAAGGTTFDPYGSDYADDVAAQGGGADAGGYYNDYLGDYAQ